MEENRTGSTGTTDLLSVMKSINAGDFGRELPENGEGADAGLAREINKLNRRLNEMAHEFTRISRELGTEGRFGGQAVVEGAEGSWKDLVANINHMAASLTDQVRDMAHCVTARANGDMSRRATVGCQGEMLELRETLDTMGEQLHTFTTEVTRVAREVGTEGKFGGQVEVRGLAGGWKELTESVNDMSANLTVQVRDMSRVTRGILEGNPANRVTAKAQGETLELKETINRIAERAGAA